MASLYKQPKSPFWWIKFREGSQVKRQSTGLRIGVGRDTRAARELCAQKSLAETRTAPIANGAGWTWVAGFLESKYLVDSHSLNSHKSRWRNLLMFMNESNLAGPAAVTRGVCISYVAWRKKADPAAGKYTACHNTALIELKTLSVLLQEALIRGWIPHNPVRSLGIKREPTREKPELTHEDIAAIRAAIKTWPNLDQRHFLHVSFEIAIHHGCRIRETCFPLTQIDFDNQTMMVNAKGGKIRRVRIHPDLMPLFLQLRADGRTHTYDQKYTNLGHRQFNPSRIWAHVFHTLGLKQKGVSFHCTRVTVATWMARSNVHEAKAKAFLGHASTTVHRIYQRLRHEDLDPCLDAIKP